MILKITVVGLYALMIIIVGIISLRKTKSFKDFALGGGAVGPWMTAFSYGTAYFSAVLFIGYAGQTGWSFGISALWVAVFNTLFGVLLVWALLGRRIKGAALRYNISTLSEYLEKRYNSSFFKLLSSIVIFIFMIPYTAAVFMGLSYLFTSSFGLNYSYVLIFIGVFTAVYMVLGGYKSMALIDVLFGIIMVISVCILYTATVKQGNGLVSIMDSLKAINPKLAKVVGPPGWWPLFSLVFLTSVAPFAMPHLMQKFIAVKDDRSIKIGMGVSTIFAALIGTVAYFVGATTRVFLSPVKFPELFTAGGAPIFDRLMPGLLNSVVPEGLTVIILLLILSASMSTLASLVLLSSSTFAKDFYAGFINSKIGDRPLTILMRIMSAVFIFLSVILAFLNIDSIVAILGVSWGAIGSFFLGPFVWGLLSRRMNKAGALVSGIGGLAACLILYFSGMPSTQAGTIGMILSLVLNPVVSLVSAESRRDFSLVDRKVKEETVEG